ncbi:gamma-glutamylcyclotransferase [Gammaproteobacteria bacterium]|nr:gamma-glutamylcyclotransferase [Gammaproteobacteria bacterium]
MMHEIFVYGTLREGYPNHHHNAGTRRSGTFRSVEKFPLVVNGQRNSPCLIDAPGKGFRVRGEVYRVDDEGLALMDKLERIKAADGYQRQQILIISDAQSAAGEISVFAYLKSVESVHDIRHGPFPEYTLEHASLYQHRK